MNMHRKLGYKAFIENKNNILCSALRLIDSRTTSPRALPT